MSVTPQATTPPPATTPWVPMWNLNGSADLRYNGDYVAGSYSDGDIVVYQGVAYLCVRPTSNPPVPWPTAGVPSGYGTTLPASPVDGQEYTLVDSATNPSWQWRFRYNAGSTSTYKWEFVGGFPYIANQSGLNMGTLNAWTALVGYSAPRSGEYAIRPAWSCGSGSGAQVNAYVGVGVAGAVALNVGNAVIPASSAGILHGSDAVVSASAGQSLQAMYYITAAVNANAAWGEMVVTPKRVS